MKFGLVAAALVPVFDSPPGGEPSAAEQPIVAGDVSSDAPRPMETVDACLGERLDEKECSLQGGEKTEENPKGDDGENVKNPTGDDGENLKGPDGSEGNETDYEPAISHGQR